MSASELDTVRRANAQLVRELELLKDDFDEAKQEKRHFRKLYEEAKQNSVDVRRELDAAKAKVAELSQELATAKLALSQSSDEVVPKQEPAEVRRYTWVSLWHGGINCKASGAKAFSLPGAH